MNRPLQSLLLLAVALAALGWWILRTDDKPQSLVQESANQQVETVESAVPLLQPTAATSSEELEVEAVNLLRSNLPGSRVTTLPAAEFGEVRVQVLHTQTKRPAVHATVWVLNRNLAEGSSILERLAFAKNIEGLLDSISERGRTNKDGIAVLPFFGGQLKIAALHGDSFTFATRKLGQEDPVIVELRPSLNVPVKVVDDSGKAVAGVPVSLRLVFGDLWRLDLMRTITDENGLAVLENVGLFKEEFDIKDALYVGLPLPLAKPIEAQIPLPDVAEELLQYSWPPKQEPLLLTMPAMGPVDVFLFDLDGQPFLEEVPVYLYLLENVGLDPQQRAELRQQTVIAAVTATAGVAHFPWSELGKEVVADCSFGGDTELSTATGPGPLSATRSSRVEIRQIQGRSMVRGQIILADGTPLPPQRVEANLRIDTPRKMQSTRIAVAIGKDGRFNFSTLPIPGKDLGSATLVFQITREHSLLFASCPLPLPLPAGSINCGALLLQQPPLLVAGTVIRPDGSPAIDQDINIEVKLNRGGDSYWREDRSLRSATLSDGRFRISGLVQDAQYRLKMKASQALPVSLEFLVGAEGIEIQLQAAGHLAGRVLVDDFIDSSKIRAVATFADVFEDTQEDHYTQQSKKLNALGFSFDDLPQTPVDIEFRLIDTNEVIEIVRGLQQGFSGNQYHPRLDPVDLRGKVFLNEIRAVNTDGNPVAAFSVVWAVDGKENRVGTSNNVARITTANPALSAIVMSRSYRAAHVDNIRGDTEVVLYPPLEVRVRLAPSALVPAGYQLGALLRPASGKFTWPRARLANFNANGFASLKVGEPGAYTLTPYLEQSEDSPNRKFWVESGPLWNKQIVHVANQAKQEVVMSVNAAQMEALRRKSVR